MLQNVRTDDHIGAEKSEYDLYEEGLDPMEAVKRTNMHCTK